MIRLDRPLIVEGKYDKSKLSSFVDALIITTDGFGVFSNKEKLRLIRRLAREKGVIVLTDSDAAGRKIRGYLRGCVGPERIVEVYIPDVYGKERRKARPSKEGKLGVEGMDTSVLIQALTRAGVVCGSEKEPTMTWSKAQLMELGLSGTPDSAQRRRKLLRRLALPENLSANALCEILGLYGSPEDVRAWCGELD